MKAKGRVISKEQIRDVYERNYGSGGFDEVEFGEIVAKLQAEISFKAGVQEVVGWLGQHTIQILDMGTDSSGEVSYNSHNLIFDLYWHLKLKEWKIE